MQNMEGVKGTHGEILLFTLLIGFAQILQFFSALPLRLLNP